MHVDRTGIKVCYGVRPKGQELLLAACPLDADRRLWQASFESHVPQDPISKTAKDHARKILTSFITIAAPSQETSNRADCASPRIGTFDISAASISSERG
jgi:hypothetical protein